MSLPGVMYALASGVLASGCGYALWYSTVKHLSSQNAATLQLSVPINASFAGVLFLNEPISFRLLLISVMVLGGVAVALLPNYDSSIGALLGNDGTLRLRIHSSIRYKNIFWRR